ncbi:MAG: 16S rRNA (guanine(966)-N(2))-methyltransferase RsmD, partial [Clostridia bacterium]|nr:16S rRNA (guanine(966)-N(2))-methyltransferase RsmD [Clostridia bacterium]
MRIISGKYRGMNLTQFQGKEIRPTADRVKESLFNILSDRVSGAKVLDLFCGSGNLGIESLSRGAAHVSFNDVSKDSISVLKKNLARLKDENYTVTALDYRQCLASGQKYDLIFIDPPYASEAGISALEIFGASGLLSENAIAVFERD